MKVWDRANEEGTKARRDKQWRRQAEDVMDALVDWLKLAEDVFERKVGGRKKRARKGGKSAWLMDKMRVLRSAQWWMGRVRRKPRGRRVAEWARQAQAKMLGDGWYLYSDDMTKHERIRWVDDNMQVAEQKIREPAN